MTRYSRSFTFRLLGISRELERLDTDAERLAAYALIRKRIYSGSLRSTFIIVSAIVFLVFFKFIAQPLGNSLRVTAVMPKWLYDGIALSMFAIVLTNSMLWIVRRRFVYEMRTHLIANGLPTCLHCGYDLSGTTAPRCPECGTPTASSVTP